MLPPGEPKWGADENGSSKRYRRCQRNGRRAQPVEAELLFPADVPGTSVNIPYKAVAGYEIECELGRGGMGSSTKPRKPRGPPRWLGGGIKAKVPQEPFVFFFLSDFRRIICALGVLFRRGNAKGTLSWQSTFLANAVRVG